MLLLMWCLLVAALQRNHWRIGVRLQLAGLLQYGNHDAGRTVSDGAFLYKEGTMQLYASKQCN